MSSKCEKAFSKATYNKPFVVSLDNRYGVPGIVSKRTALYIQLQPANRRSKLLERRIYAMYIEV